MYRLIPAAAFCAMAIAACDSALAPTTPPEAGPVLLNQGQGQQRVAICHYDEDTGLWTKITVGAPAEPAHLAHGDTYPGTGGLGPNCEAQTIIVLDPDNAYNTSVYGGGGGGDFVESCPAGYVAVGLEGNNGGWFGWATLVRVRLHCQLLLPDGSLGASAWTTPKGDGSLFSGSAFSGDCIEAALVTSSGHHSAYVARLDGGCSTIDQILDSPGISSTIGPWAGSGSFGSNTPFSIACGSGHVITGMVGRSGNVLDAVGYICTPVVRPTV